MAGIAATGTDHNSTARKDGHTQCINGSHTQCINGSATRGRSAWMTGQRCVARSLLACKGNGAYAQARGQGINVILAVPFNVRQILSDGDDCGEHCHKTSDKPALNQAANVPFTSPPVGCRLNNGFSPYPHAFGRCTCCVHMMSM